MDLIQKLYEEQKGHLIPDDENIEVIVGNYIQNWTRNEYIHFLHELNDSELQRIVKGYITEELLKKMSEEDDSS